MTEPTAPASSENKSEAKSWQVFQQMLADRVAQQEPASDPMEAAHEAPRCQRVRLNGLRCEAPALKGQRHCYAHRHLLQRRQRGAPLHLPPLEDAESIQFAVMEIMRGLLENKLDRPTAATLLYGLQIAASNLKRVKFEPIPAWVVTEAPEDDPNEAPVDPISHWMKETSPERQAQWIRPPASYWRDEDDAEEETDPPRSVKPESSHTSSHLDRPPAGHHESGPGFSRAEQEQKKDRASAPAVVPKIEAFAAPAESRVQRPQGPDSASVANGKIDRFHEPPDAHCRCPCRHRGRRIPAHQSGFREPRLPQELGGQRGDDGAAGRVRGGDHLKRR